MPDFKEIPDPPPKNFEGNPRFKDKAAEIRNLLNGITGRDEYDVASNVSDLLGDLMIFCHETRDEDGEPLDFDGLLGLAERHFEKELNIDDIEAGRLLEEGYCNWDDDTDQLVLVSEDKPDS